MKVYEYFSNNSGGSYWLDDEDWKKLEKAGWRIAGFDDFVYTNSGDYKKDNNGLPIINRKSTTPVYAYKKFDSLDEAIADFESITGEDYYAEGCSCCGQPHSICGLQSINSF